MRHLFMKVNRKNSFKNLSAKKKGTQWIRKNEQGTLNKTGTHK